MGRSRSKRKNNGIASGQPTLDLIEIADIPDSLNEANTEKASDETSDNKLKPKNDIAQKSSSKTVRSLQELKSIAYDVPADEPENQDNSEETKYPNNAPIVEKTSTDDNSIIRRKIHPQENRQSQVDVPDGAGLEIKKEKNEKNGKNEKNVKAEDKKKVAPKKEPAVKAQPKKNSDAKEIRTVKKDTSSETKISAQPEQQTEFVRTDQHQISEFIRRRARESKKTKLNQMSETVKALSNDPEKSQNLSVQVTSKIKKYIEENKNVQDRVEDPSKSVKLSSNRIKMPVDKRPSAAVSNRAGMISPTKDNKSSKPSCFKPINQAFTKCIEKSKFGLELCMDNILQDYVDTEFNWLYKWLITTGQRKLKSIIDLRKSFGNIVYKDVLVKCLMDIITYITTKMYLDGVQEIDVILNDSGMHFCTLNMGDDVNIYAVELNREVLDGYSDNEDELISHIIDSVIKIQNLYITKRYALSVDSILKGLDNLPQQDDLLQLSSKQVEQLPRVVDEKAIFFRQIPKYFYDRFMQYKSVYRYLDACKHRSCFINYIRRTAKDINLGIRYLRSTLIDTENALTLYYEGELELIYKFLFDKIIGTSMEYKRLLTEDVMRALFIAGKTPKNISEVSILPVNDEEKIIYTKCLINLLEE